MAEAQSAMANAIDYVTAQRDAAEQKLESAGKKLETLRGSLHRLVSAIFGKSDRTFCVLVFLFSLFFADFTFYFLIGKEHDILSESPAKKLTCTFALVKKLFEGACKDIGATQ